MTRYAKAPAELEQEVRNVSKFFNRVRDAAACSSTTTCASSSATSTRSWTPATIRRWSRPIPRRPPSTSSPCTRPRASSGRWCSWSTACRTSSRPPGAPSRSRCRPALIKDTLPTGDFHAQEERRLFYVGMTRARERPLLHQRGGHGRHAPVEGEPVRAGGARPAEGRGAAVPRAGHRGAAAPCAAAGRTGGRVRALPAGRGAGGEPPAGGRLPDLPAQVPVRPPPAHPAAAASRHRLRQRAAHGGGVLPAPARGRELHLAGGLPPGLRGRLAQRGLPHPGARGAAEAGGHRGADPLLPRGGSLGVEARLGGAGVRLRPGPDAGAGGASIAWTRRPRAPSSSTTSPAT